MGEPGGEMQFSSLAALVPTIHAVLSNIRLQLRSRRIKVN
jgi:hypothetical protein